MPSTKDQVQAQLLTSSNACTPQVEEIWHEYTVIALMNAQQVRGTQITTNIGQVQAELQMTFDDCSLFTGDCSLAGALLRHPATMLEI